MALPGCSNRCRRLATLLAALLLSGATALVAPVAAQTVISSATRAARLQLGEGSLSIRAADGSLLSGVASGTLGPGAQLDTGDSGRAELALGATMIRVGARSRLVLASLDDQRAFLTLLQGSLNLRVRTVAVGPQVEINTPNLAFSLSQPGEYRVDVDPSSASTRITVHTGGGVAYGESGQALVLQAPRQQRFQGRNLAALGPPAGATRDALDLWADQREGSVVSTTPLVPTPQPMPVVPPPPPPRDPYGQWQYLPSQGWVWVPSGGVVILPPPVHVRPPVNRPPPRPPEPTPDANLDWNQRQQLQRQRDQSRKDLADEQWKALQQGRNFQVPPEGR